MILSIIMITVPDRKRQFNKLKQQVREQINYCHAIHSTLGEIEIIEVNSPKVKDGGESIGRKRQMGLDLSAGDYVCWLDDDDQIAPNYVETIVRLCNAGADVCTFQSLCKIEGFWMLVNMHFKTKHDDQAKPGVINRRPYHVCAFRRGVLDGVKFPDTNVDEDTGFIEQALKNCRTWVHSEAILHQYNRVVKSLAKEI